ncbi:ABC transporter permease subunit [Streptomyces litchfieldiae]|uniref:ABC transporter permease subunit n=1 Tax=Streptomyces litchfieldiae TaxID=3075543 RepID=A0ABU2MPY2_9ACTN|nr:ABC transporter permease subunit [Streptomyces sp. DSM 44938]MDT0343682.1 ABC transporter permease subunit [Streptomyces sp. DSM 44938]
MPAPPGDRRLGAGGPEQLLLPHRRQPRVPQRPDQRPPAHRHPDGARLPCPAAAAAVPQQPGRRAAQAPAPVTPVSAALPLLVIAVAIFQQMLGNAGMLNTFLARNDLPTVEIIGTPELFMSLITAQSIWKDAGWGTIIFLAALARVDEEQYEAAAIDGANARQRLIHVTLPALRGLFILLLILRRGHSLSVGFEQIILQQGPVGLEASEVLDTWLYN